MNDEHPVKLEFHEDETALSLLRLCFIGINQSSLKSCDDTQLNDIASQIINTVMKHLCNILIDESKRKKILQDFIDQSNLKYLLNKESLIKDSSIN